MNSWHLSFHPGPSSEPGRPPLSREDRTAIETRVFGESLTARLLREKNDKWNWPEIVCALFIGIVTIGLTIYLFPHTPSSRESGVVIVREGGADHLLLQKFRELLRQGRRSQALALLAPEVKRILESNDAAAALNRSELLADYWRQLPNPEAVAAECRKILSFAPDHGIALQILARQEPQNFALLLLRTEGMPGDLRKREIDRRAKLATGLAGVRNHADHELRRECDFQRALLLAGNWIFADFPLEGRYLEPREEALRLCAQYEREDRRFLELHRDILLAIHDRMWRWGRARYVDGAMRDKAEVAILIQDLSRGTGER